MVEEQFLIDSNSFMAPYRQYYAFDLIPTYWDELSKRTESGRLVLATNIQKLRKEIVNLLVKIQGGEPGDKKRIKDALDRYEI